MRDTRISTRTTWRRRLPEFDTAIWIMLALCACIGAGYGLLSILLGDFTIPDNPRYGYPILWRIVIFWPVWAAAFVILIVFKGRFFGGSGEGLFFLTTVLGAATGTLVGLVIIWRSQL